MYVGWMYAFHRQCQGRRPTYDFSVVYVKYFDILSVADNIRLAVIAYETREMSRNSKRIPREFDLTAVQGHPRSSISVSMESPYVTSY